MSEAMRARGPDGQGSWESPDGRVGFAHRRLAIIDLSGGGAQPMSSDEGRFVVTFNGEIYNYRDIRRELEADGCVFRSSSDTEVLLHLYRQRGERMVDALRGMYAFAIWDRDEGSLFLARDPFGIKPLYYADDGRTFRFASQVKALSAGGAVDAAPDPAGICGFLIWGAVPEPFTLLAAVRALPAGTTMLVDRDGKARHRTFFDIREELLTASARMTKLGELREVLAAALDDTVRSHLISDVPVGLFLSAGIDSGIIASIASSLAPGRLRTLTVGFEEFRGTPNDETPLAAEVAALFGTAHETHWIRREDFEADLDAIFEAMDQPSVDGVNTWLVSKAAARAGMKVALSGLGGDELFGGYATFRQVPSLARKLRWTAGVPTLGRALRRATSGIARSISSPKYAGLAEYGGTLEGAYLLRRALHMPWELDGLLDPQAVESGLEKLATLTALRSGVDGVGPEFARVASLEMQWYMRNQLLRDADWASMAHSLEVRVPLVDIELFRCVSPFMMRGAPASKQDAAAALHRPLPRTLLSRPKTGFSTPVRSWIDSGAGPTARGLRGWAARILDRSLGRRRGILTRARMTDESVAIYLIGQLGDSLVSLPAMDAIRRRHATAPLVLVTDRHAGSRSLVSSWDVIGPLQWFDAVVFYEPGRGVRAKLAAAGRVASALRRMRVGTVYNLVPTQRIPRDASRDAFFFRRLVGAHRYVAAEPFAAPARGPGGELARLDPEWQRLLDVVGAPPVSSTFRLPDVAHARIYVEGLLESLGIVVGQPLLAVAPGSKMAAKRWPLERFASVGSLLLKDDPRMRAIVLGDHNDVELGRALQAQWGTDRCVDLTGRLSVHEAGAALRLASLYLGNDTGTMHLAAMAGCRCVAVFSSRDYPGRWEPIGPGNRVLRTRIACEGCMLEVCVERGNACLKEISIESVTAACDEVLENANAKEIT